eukprot:GFUD01016972.1.p1 GENE.GFUD01016972.1~~GFUD01016972.1.p1  ORF type:complete len:2025 (+),score=728.26 GFUD01016972.1:126-6200(+)
MVDRQSKDFYQQQLAQAAWANFRGASGYNPASAHAGFAGPGGGAMGGHPAPTSTNPYENYMQQLQQFAGLSGSQANPAMFGGSNFLGNGAKDMSPGFSSPFGFPPGHPMHFPGISNYRPLPAHSPLPAHVKNSSGPATPLPAHMRSSPYQQSNYHTPPYSYQMGQGVAGYGHPTPPSHPPPDQRQPQYPDQAQAAAAAAAAAQFSKSAPQSRSSSQDPGSRRQAGLPNGSGVPGGVPGVPPGVPGVAPGVPGLLPPTDVSSAYTQLQQLTAAYSQAATASASAKDAGKKATPPTTNNNYPYPYPPSTVTTSTSSGPPTSYTNSTMGGGDPSYDQIAAALLNRFGGQFSPQLLMEMSNMSKSGQTPNPTQAYQQMTGFPPSLSKEPPKLPSKSQPLTQTAHKPPQPEGKADTVKADRRPPDPGPGPAQQNGPIAGKQATPQGYILPNIPRPGSSQLFPAQQVYSPDQSAPPAGLNSSGHSNDSHLSVCSPPPARGGQAQDGLPGGQPSGQPGGGGGQPSLPGGQPSAGTPTYLSSSSISPSPAISSPTSSHTLSPGHPPGQHSPVHHQVPPTTSNQSSPTPFQVPPTSSHQSPPTSQQVPPNSHSPPTPPHQAAPLPHPMSPTSHPADKLAHPTPSPPPPQHNTTPTLSATQTVESNPSPTPDTPPVDSVPNSANGPPTSNTTTPNHKPPTPKAPSLPLAHSVASQLSSPAPSFGLAGPASMTSKIKDLQSRQGAAKPAGAASKNNEDRSELKGLWKMQAEFQKKNVKAKATSNMNSSPQASPATQTPIRPASKQTATPPLSAAGTAKVVVTPPLTSAGTSKALQSPATPRQPPVLTAAVSTPAVHNPALQSFPPQPPPSHYTPLTVPSPPISASSYNLPFSNSKPSHPPPPHTNIMQVPQSAPGVPLYQPPYHGGPPLLHTPRSPPHPPPPRPPQQPYSHLNPAGPPSLPPGPEHSHSYNPGLQSQPSFSTSSQHSYFPPSLPPHSPYHAPPYLHPAPLHNVKSFQPISPPEQPKFSKTQDPPPVNPVNPNPNDRMEIKNSGIPGPSAITWKRKSVEDSPSSISKAKKRKIVIPQEAGDDPYSFEEEEKPSGGQQAAKGGDQPNGGGVGPVYKYKSALLSREVDPESLSPPVLEQERLDIGESDESSRSSGGNVSPVKKKNKRPKLEEWSVNKDAKVSSKDPTVKPDKPGERSERCEGGGGDKSNAGARKGPLWGLPVVPKPPVKPVEKPREKPKVVEVVEEVMEVQTNQAGSKVSVNDVWLQAFGAGSAKPKKKVVPEPVARNGAKKSAKAEKVEREVVAKPSSILDIPPEVRRKPRPVFGGLIHFSPDWARAVRRHHERCRIPQAIENSSLLKPKILAGQLTPKKSYEDFARKDMVSPPDLLAIERERVERATATTTLPDPVTASTEDELPGQLPSIVETILENRKKLREAAKMGRMYKIPFMKEKKKRMRQPVPDESQDVALGLLPTPGLPLLTDDTKEVLVGSGFGNFRRYTLVKYLDSLNDSSGDQKPKWNPDVLDSKTRRQSSMTKPVTSLREIFGLDAPPKKAKKVVERVTTPVETSTTTTSRASTPVSVKKEKRKKTSTASHVASPCPAAKEKKFVPKERQALSQTTEVSDDGAYSQEVGDPTEDDSNLQTELGGFALDLLEDNPSWTKQVTIQNLVIWEPAEQPEVAKKKKGKKKRTKKSGLDFTSHKRKSKSANISRAGSPSGEEVHDIEYTLDNVVAESSRWVIDKNAGETILHRASKMGYPDVVAYSLDRLEMAPMDKDYAGLTPLHKAAFKGHETVVKALLSYGADPSAGVKGTRALHEAIEGASPSTARTLLAYGADPLLHDYSGNMPLDLSANDPTMQLYITNLLADLHGKTPAPAMRSSTSSCSPPVRWNVSHCPDFHQPGPSLPSLEKEKVSASKKNLEDMFSFELTSHPLPATYQFRDRAGEWVLYRDLKDYTKKYCQGKVDVRTKGELLELKKSEFLKTSHCTLLDRRALEVRFHAREQEDIVILVKVDKFVRKIFNSEVTHVAV